MMSSDNTLARKTDSDAQRPESRRDHTYSIDIDGALAAITLHDGAFMLGTDLEEKAEFFAAFEELESNASVEAILFIDDTNAFDDAAHRRFLDSVSDPSKKAGGAAEQILSREENALDQWVLKTARCKKLVVWCLQGVVTTPFMGLCLAADFRFASSEMRFSLSHVALGVPPTGALAYWLPRFVGRGEAMDLLLSGGYVTADEALDMGIVDHVAESGEFVDQCRSIVTEHLRSAGASISYTKSLMAPQQELQEFLEREIAVRRLAYYQLGH